MEYEAVIGLEVHAQLLTDSKIFCSCSTRFGAEPNTQVCPICLGMPGVLPVLNKKALEFAIRAALATNCRVSPRSRFARKNYFYPDLPKGYQISQYEEPLSTGGWLEIESNGLKKRVRIRRIHLEEDAGKLIHEDSEDWSYVDLNRAGVPLIEIVSEPDISSPEEAVSYLKKLRSILVYIGVCDGNMEEGSLRCDANVSIRPKGSGELGTKTEIKNVNSFKFIQKALEYEIRRQISLLESGDRVVQETRLFDSNRGVTFSMRSKEEAHDYRYFPDPDLLPVTVDSRLIEEIRGSLPELPDARFKRFVEEYGIPAYDAEILTSSKEIADYFEGCLKHYDRPKAVSNWIMTEVLRELKGEGEGIREFRVTPERLAELLKLIDDGTISGKMAKDVFGEMVLTGKAAGEIVSEKGVKQISDHLEIERIVSLVIEKNPNELSRYRAGQEKLLGFFVGEVMKATQGKANPKLVNEILKKKLSES
ncbi:MAG TPA: Asp-tRNA(Asn)/Glu-tRNA(Gln) amidotransferase subunit GatB [Thermodesulfobacteriota bacterium]|nr:Asp-tRNA(Asn)/Glu-tRNA(Gln) amidotransferase subunit GatB [Thermodesulfobacteriota bacterium]